MEWSRECGRVVRCIWVAKPRQEETEKSSSPKTAEFTFHRQTVARMREFQKPIAPRATFGSDDFSSSNHRQVPTLVPTPDPPPLMSAARVPTAPPGTLRRLLVSPATSRVVAKNTGRCFSRTRVTMQFADDFDDAELLAAMDAPIVNASTSITFVPKLATAQAPTCTKNTPVANTLASALTTTLATYFGHDTFRSGQLEVIAAAVSGRDTCVYWRYVFPNNHIPPTDCPNTTDIYFISISTGSGKSLCYQVRVGLSQIWGHTVRRHVWSAVRRTYIPTLFTALYGVQLRNYPTQHKTCRLHTRQVASVCPYRTRALAFRKGLTFFLFPIAAPGAAHRQNVAGDIAAGFPDGGPGCAHEQHGGEFCWRWWRWR